MYTFFISTSRSHHEAVSRKIKNNKTCVWIAISLLLAASMIVSGCQPVEVAIVAADPDKAPSKVVSMAERVRFQDHVAGPSVFPVLVSPAVGITGMSHLDRIRFQDRVLYRNPIPELSLADRIAFQDRIWGQAPTTAPKTVPTMAEKILFQDQLEQPPSVVVNGN